MTRQIQWILFSSLAAVSFFDICSDSLASVEIGPRPKTYAVFVARYNRRTHEAFGGVAGTAFFVSQHRALTAFHVLQNTSFASSTTDEVKQVWLVHEGQPALELHQNQIQTDKN